MKKYMLAVLVVILVSLLFGVLYFWPDYKDINEVSFSFPEDYEVTNIEKQNRHQILRRENKPLIFIKEIEVTNARIPYDNALQYVLESCLASGPQGNTFCEKTDRIEYYENPNGIIFTMFYVTYINEGIEYKRAEFGPFYVTGVNKKMLIVGPTDFVLEDNNTSTKVTEDIFDMVNSGRLF